MFIELAIGAGVIWGLAKVVGKAKAADKLVIDVTARIHKITFSKITIVADALVKNPTKQDFRFRRPFVTLKYKGKTLGTSDVKETIIDLKPYSQSSIKDIVIDIQLLQLPAALLDAFTILKTAKGTLEIDVETIVPVVTQAGDVPVTYDDKIIL
jgi:hypothetical protein